MVKMSMNRDKNIKEAFRSVKHDIRRLSDMQNTLSQSIMHKAEIQDKKIRQLEDRFMKRTAKLEKEIRPLSKHIRSIDPELRKIEGLLKKIDDEQVELFSENKFIQDKIKDILLKIESITRASVDIRDVDEMFVRRKDAEKMLLKQSKKFKKDIQRLNALASDYEDNKGRYAQKDVLEKIQEEVVDLKSSIILRDDLEITRDRIEDIEKTISSRLRELKKTVDSYEEKIVEVYKLKKDFVTREQFLNQRKEIDMIISGLKELSKKKGQAKRKLS